MKPITVALAAFLTVGRVLTPQRAAAFTTDQQEDICANPWIIYCENFEDRQMGTSSPNILDLGRAKFKNRGWALSAYGGMGVVTDDKFDGSKSFKFIYPAAPPTKGSTSFMDSSLGESYPDIYIRMYTRWSSNWKLSAVSEKHLEADGGYAAFLFNTIFAKPLSVGNNFSLSAPGGQFYPNMGTGDATLHGSGQTAWNCLEVHLRMNSSLNGYDGLVEAWYNGNKRIYFPDVNVSSQRTNISSILLSGYWNCVDPGNGVCDPNDPRNQHAEMYRWHDNIVIGTQRIGCLGSDNQSPAKPAGLRLL